MPDIYIDIRYRMHVVPEWYDPSLLSGNGTLEEQVCEYEKERAEKDGIYVVDLNKEKVTVTFVPEPPVAHCGDSVKHSKHKFKDKGTQFSCNGLPAVTLDEVMQPEEDADIEEYVEPEDTTCAYCLSKTCPGSCPESMEDPEPPSMPDYKDE